MTQELIKKVVSMGAVDTGKYRYVYEADNTGARIKRIPLSYLDTSAALDKGNWKVVKVIAGE